MGSAWQEGGSEGRGLGLGAQQASQCLSGQGKHWLWSLLFLTPLPHHLPQGLPRCSSWTLHRGWVLLQCRNSSPPPAAPQGGRFWRAGLYFCSPFPPSHSLRTCMAGGGLGGQRIGPGISAGSWGPKWAGETWPCSLLILCPPSGSPIYPFACGIPFPPPAAPQGCQSRPASTSPPLSLPPGSTSYLVSGGSSHPLRCPWSPTGAW